jgi:hypothetical protein
MSAYGPKWTSLVAPRMSAFGGKAETTTRRFPSGGRKTKRTNTTRRTSAHASSASSFEVKAAGLCVVPPGGPELLV